MKKLFLIISILLLSATTATAGGIFSGCMGSGFGTHGLRADTEAYITRVEADGGTVIDSELVDAAYGFLDTYNLTPVIWVDPNFGVKKDGSNYVSKMYDLTDNDYDCSQGTSGQYPVWNSNQKNSLATIYFDGTNDYLNFGTFSAKPASFTACLVFADSRTTVISTPWYSWTATYSNWGALNRGISNGDLYLIISNQSSNQFTGGYTATGQISNDTYYLRTDRYATGSANLYIYLNTTSKSLSYAYTSAATNAGTGISLSLASDGTQLSNPYNGYIGSFVLFSSSLSDTDRGYVEAFLDTKYDLY